MVVTRSQGDNKGENKSIEGRRLRCRRKRRRLDQHKIRIGGNLMLMVGGENRIRECGKTRRGFVRLLYSERTLVLTTSADASTVEEEGCVIGL